MTFAPLTATVRVRARGGVGVGVPPPGVGVGPGAASGTNSEIGSSDAARTVLPSSCQTAKPFPSVARPTSRRNATPSVVANETGAENDAPPFVDRAMRSRLKDSPFCLLRRQTAATVPAGPTARSCI